MAQPPTSRSSFGRAPASPTRQIAGVYHVDVDADGDVVTLTILKPPVTCAYRSRKLSIKPTSGVSGNDIAVSGAGYNKGISAIFIEASSAWLNVGTA